MKLVPIFLIACSFSFAQGEKSEPITIEIGNMKSKVPEVMGLAKQLDREKHLIDTEQYADRYMQMATTLKTAGLSNLTEDEMKAVMDVEEPTTNALQLHFERKQMSKLAVDNRIKDIEQAVVRKLQAEAEAAKLAEERRQVAVKEQQEQEKINAMNRQAEAHEKMARVNALNYRLNERLSRYYY